MNRREFLSYCAALGLSPSLESCATLPTKESLTSFNKRVHILGAGAAGMSAAYLLQLRGIDVRVLEAAPKHGGRMKHTTDFVDFPVPLGAEWLHSHPKVLGTIAERPAEEIGIAFQSYDQENDTYGYFDDGLTLEQAPKDTDLKFIGSSWFAFFDTFIFPHIAAHTTFNTEIVAIDSTGDVIALTASSGEVYETDCVVVTVPLRVLKTDALRFTPPLSATKQDAISRARALGGIKVFIEFEEAFYPTFLKLENSDLSQGDHLYYDASYGQDTDAHVLGLFAVGSAATPYQQHSGTMLRDFVLAELDAVFDGAATRSYVQHIAQNWNNEPFIGQAYLFDDEDYTIPPILWEPIDQRIFFAGEAYTRHDDWGAVHDAAQAARDVVTLLLGV